MIRLRPGDRLVVASHNRGKVKEIKELIAPFGIQTLGAAEFGLAEPDDSGLCVAALDGAPGIYSARWAGADKDFRLAMRRVEEELRAKETHDLRAYFVCALALAMPGAKTEIFEGRVFGALTFPPRGGNGFGYDPIFVPEGRRFTFGEMDPAAKHAMSHRARAFEKFVGHAIAPATDR